MRREEGERREKGVEQLESRIQAAAHCPPLVWRYRMILSYGRSNSGHKSSTTDFSFSDKYQEGFPN